MCNKQLDITLSDLHKHIHRSHAERTWHISTGTSTPVTFADVCHCFKVSLVQLPKWKFQFNGKLKTNGLNLTLIKTKSKTFAQQLPSGCGRKTCAVWEEILRDTARSQLSDRSWSVLLNALCRNSQGF